MLQQIWQWLQGNVAQTVEEAFKAYQTFETGAPVTVPPAYVTLSNGNRLAIGGTFVKTTTGIPIDLNLSYLFGLLAPQIAQFFSGQQCQLEPFTIAAGGEYVEITLTVQLEHPAQQQPGAPAAAGAVPAAAPGSGTPAPRPVTTPPGVHPGTVTPFPLAGARPGGSFFTPA